MTAKPDTIGGYAVVEKPRLIDASAVAELFGKPANWFGRSRVRKALTSRGFPRPVIRGRWLRSAVDTWLEQEGTRRRHPG